MEEPRCLFTLKECFTILLTCESTVNRVYFARYYCSRMANQNFRERVFFANGQKAMKTKICQNLKFYVSVNRSSSPARVVLIQFNRPNNNTVSAAMCTVHAHLVVLSMSENLFGRCMLLFPILVHALVPVSTRFWK